MRVVAAYALTAFVLVTLNFFLPRALPGDPIAALANPRSGTYVGDARTRDAVMHYYGLDRPLLSQYGRYLDGLVHGNLGTSIEYAAPVGRVLAQRLPWTLLLVGTAWLFATTVGMLAGVHSGWRHRRRADAGLLALFLTVYNVPVFFLASLAVYLFAVQLGWFPLAGAQTPFGAGGLTGVGDVAYHLVLPAAALAVQFAPLQYLVMRASVVSELAAPYLLLGRAKGLRERTLEYHYAGRNALLPSITVAGLQLGSAITAAIFVETVFAYPGVGRLLFDAVGNRDYPLMQGCFLVLTILVVTANFLADAVNRILDPRTTT